MESDWKGLEFRGREKLFCFWVVLVVVLREVELSWLISLRVSREEGGSGGLLCLGVGVFFGIFY